MKKYSFLILIIIFVCLVAGGFVFKNKPQQILGESTQDNLKPISENFVNTVETKSETKIETESTIDADEKLPEKKNISEYQIAGFPFVPQAPHGVWNEIYDEACEEASVVLVEYFSQNKSIDAQIMDGEIQKLVNWQNQNWQGHFDLTVEQTAQMAKEVYNLNLEIRTINSIEEIKNIITQNQIIIAPTAGRLLGNPYFRQPGPVYHMLVITGFDNKDIITQDVGTKRGENYRYNEKILFNAIHDWNGSPENINDGPKQILVFS
jgi:hypothetical protein